MRRSSCLCWSPWCDMRMRARSEISATWTMDACDRAWDSIRICSDCGRRIDPLRIAWYAARESRIQVPNKVWGRYQWRIYFSGLQVDARRTTGKIGEIENI